MRGGRLGQSTCSPGGWQLRPPVAALAQAARAPPPARPQRPGPPAWRGLRGPTPLTETHPAPAGQALSHRPGRSFRGTVEASAVCLSTSAGPAERLAQRNLSLRSGSLHPQNGLPNRPGSLHRRYFFARAAFVYCPQLLCPKRGCSVPHPSAELTLRRAGQGLAVGLGQPAIAPTHNKDAPVLPGYLPRLPLHSSTSSANTRQARGLVRSKASRPGRLAAGQADMPGCFASFLLTRCQTSFCLQRTVFPSPCYASMQCWEPGCGLVSDPTVNTDA